METARTLHMLHALEADVDSLASTVRNGFKWADLELDENLQLCVCTRDPETHEVQGRGVVRGLWFGRFRDIPARLLQWEHERKSREYRGLLESMANAYGDDFNDESPVTVIIYERVE